MSMLWRTARNDSLRSRPEGPDSDNRAGRMLPGLRQQRDEGRSGVRDLERRIRRLLRSLDVQPPLSVPDLCAALTRRRGRPIELRAFPLPSDGPLGAWLEMAVADVIVFQQETTSYHQDHIVLHELGHILADHPGPPGTVVWESLLPGLKADAIRRALHRCSYDTKEEREAELVATIVGEWATILDRVAPGRQSDDPSARRVQAALGDHQGWL
ncbi:hypothetical protein OG785_31970 [Streptomyces sp. NBC_00006]|uniref:hypothetical protein n=1 Tax=Streptomyces sp. NBC_00006 TaxID=2975619 RepID=UPI00225AF1F0|nr:hypothetical protein [Streptomyces sp. NBC_00006]MCX5535157.1 hypothetical protein [Streptomyces sp. NBC_00006]